MQYRSSVCGAVMAALALWLPAARAAAPMVTIAEGKSALVSGGAAYLPGAGVRLNPCDVVHTGPQAFVQVEFEDGGKIELGHDSRLVFELPQGEESVVGPHFLISGWAKVTVPKREKARPYRIDTPHFVVLTEGGVAVLRVADDDGEFFVEQGTAIALVAAGPSVNRVTVGTGRTFLRKGAERGTVTDRANAAFVQGMPRAFRDSLPSLLPQLKARDVPARRANDYNPADAETWLKSVPGLRVCLADVSVRRAQEALESRGFAVGPIDGIVGPRTRAALRAYQQQRGLTPTGQPDPDTLRSLDIADRR